jgi:hypothetical protein
VRGAVGEASYEELLAEFAADRPAWFDAGKDAYFAVPGSGVSPPLVADAVATILRSPLEDSPSGSAARRCDSWRTFRAEM